MTTSRLVAQCVLFSALGLSALSGCNANVQNCPSVQGTYVPDYRPLSGTCGPIQNPFMVPIAGGAKPVTQIMNLANGKVATEVVLKGCSVRVTQTVQDAMGHPASEIDGDPIHIDSANELSGMVDFMQFDTMTGDVTCTGQYEARFLKQDTQLGGAATSAGL